MSEFDNISTDSDKEGIINRVFPEELFNDDGSVNSNNSSTIDPENITIRIKELPKFTPEQEQEFANFLEEHKDELSFKSGDSTLDTQKVIEELKDVVKEKSVAVDPTGAEDDPNAAPTGAEDDPNAAPNAGPVNAGQDDANNQPPQAVEEVKTTVNAKNIKDGLEGMKYENIGIEMKKDENGEVVIEVTAKPPPAQGGKSKKKQMKPKNKSNKKMKKKQTKKGGKQIKKRSLKRKMKK
tara:strand:- start:815 stop:1528 length:714 start_codon:yes stop_codon:yes gene_type:complete